MHLLSILHKNIIREQNYQKRNGVLQTTDGHITVAKLFWKTPIMINDIQNLKIVLATSVSLLKS